MRAVHRSRPVRGGLVTGQRGPAGATRAPRRQSWPVRSGPVTGRRGRGHVSQAPRRYGRATPYLFLAPWLVGLVGFTVGPLLASLYLSFTNYDLLSAPSFAGLKNYQDMIHDPQYWQAVMVTVKYVVIGVPLKLGVALGVAMLLKDGLRALGIYRAIYYVPSLLGGNVAVAILWQQLFGQQGAVNQLLGLVHLQGLAWVDDPKTSLYTLIVLELWQFGSPMLIFLAALKQMPKELYDAASTDGAGAIRKFWSITLPLLTPIIFFNLILQMIGSFQAFTPAFIVSGGTGGPLGSTMFYTLYLYIQGFGNLRMGYASAMAWTLLVVVGAITAIIFWSAKYWVYYRDAK